MNNSPLIFYDIFRSFNSVLAFTTRKSTLNHAAPRFTGDSVAVFSDNRKQLARIAGIQDDQLVFPRQTHTGIVAEVSKIPSKELAETDALLTNVPGICLCVQTADCVPLLLFDPVAKAIGAVHAGWRGTVKQIALAAVTKMENNYGSLPQNILALIGPSISPAVYEVGEEVTEAVREKIPNPELSIKIKQKEKKHLDLWEANRQVLLESGLISKNIQVYGECSFQNERDFFSARRDGIATGRNVSGIMLHPSPV